MPEEKPAQEFELADGKVRERAGLTALFPKDSDTYMRRLDHVHIVSSIANSQRRLVFAVGSYEADESRFLLGRGAVDNEAFSLHEGINDLLAHLGPHLLFNRLYED